MKFTTTSSALVLLTTLLATSHTTAEGTQGRRSLRLDNLVSKGANGMQRRVAEDLAASASANKMLRKTRRSLEAITGHQQQNKRHPEPSAFGAIPMMDIGVGPIVGVTKRGDVASSMGEHNGEVGSHAVVQNAVNAGSSTTGSMKSSSDSSSTSSSSSSGNGTSTSASTDSASSDEADAEDCEAEDDEEDGEDCEDEDDSADDDEECEAEDDSADEEDCEEEDDDSSESTASASSTADSATSASSSSDDSGLAAAKTQAAVVNIKQGNGQSSSSSNKASSPSSSSSSSSSVSSSSSAASQPTSTSSASSSSYTGTATWYMQNGNAGACGNYNPDSAKIIALYTSVYGDGSKCGKKVKITNLDDGGSVEAVVADMCPSCGGPEDIDLSVGTFSAIDSQYKTHGVRNIEWHFLD